MSLVWNPHELQLWKLEPEIVEERVVGNEWTLAQTFSGLLVEKTANELRDLVDLESENPAIILLDLDDAISIELGDQIVLDEVRYRVVADLIRFEMGLPTDHAKVVVERLDS